VTRYRFRFDRRYLPLLAAVGVTPATAWVDVSADGIDARFGPWRCRTPVDNVIDVCVGGPYSAARAVGARLSFTDQGLTFGTTTSGGVCLLLRTPVPGLEPTGTLRHPGVTVTVADRDGFAQHVRSLAGLPRG
jgi:hypothetical protein